MKKMCFDYSRLIRYIHARFSLEQFAAIMNTSTEHIEQLLSNSVQWSMEEMNRACSILEIPLEFIPVVFFTEL